MNDQYECVLQYYVIFCCPSIIIFAEYEVLPCVGARLQSRSSSRAKEQFADSKHCPLVRDLITLDS